MLVKRDIEPEAESYLLVCEVTGDRQGRLPYTNNQGGCKSNTKATDNTSNPRPQRKTWNVNQQDRYQRGEA